MVTGDSLNSSYIRSAICHFVECTITTPHNMPAELFDLHQASYKPFKPSTHLHIFKRELQFKNENRPMHVYLIKQVASIDSRTVMLHDPATVKECYRQFETLAKIVAFLFLNGRPLNVLVVEQCTPPPPPMHVHPSLTLGYHSQDYKPGLPEYHYYEHVRKQFCNLPHGRAALLRGGIIWRLALESIGTSAAEVLAFNGPSQEVHQRGIPVQDPDTSVTIWDDNLTEAEMDLICGVYTVHTGVYL